MLSNLKFFARAIWTRKGRACIELYHRAQWSLFGWKYLVGVRRLQADGVAAYMESNRRHVSRLMGVVNASG